MASLYSLSKTVIPSTTVNNGTPCWILPHERRRSDFETQIALAKHNVLDILDVRKVGTGGVKLSLFARFTFPTEIFNVYRVARPFLPKDQNCDVLLLHMRDDNFACVEYDPSRHDLRNVSLHHFGYAAVYGGRRHLQGPKFMRMDPLNKVLVSMLGSRRLAVFPVLDESDDTLTQAELSGKVRGPVFGATYLLNLDSIVEETGVIMDMCFLHGYTIPTLAILQEANTPAWSGKLNPSNDSMTISVISFDLALRKHTVIWSVKRLPYDCLAIEPVPRPLGGLLLLCKSACVYLDQGKPPLGVFLNHTCATKYPDLNLTANKSKPFRLVDPRLHRLDMDRYVIGTATGEIFSVRLHGDSRTCRGMQVQKVGQSVPCTEMFRVDDDHVFIVSQSGNSMLVKVVKQYGSGTEVKTEEQNGEEDGPSVKKLKLDDVKIKEEDADGDDEDERLFYDDEEDNRGRSNGTVGGTGSEFVYTFQVQDQILNLGPVKGVSIGERLNISRSFMDETNPQVDYVATAGGGRSGSLLVVSMHHIPQVVTTFELPTYYSVFSVPGAASSVSDAYSGNTAPTSLIPHHTHLLLSSNSRTAVLSCGDEFTEVNNVGFVQTESTIGLVQVHRVKNWVVQITKTRLVLIDVPGKKKLSETNLPAGKTLRNYSGAGHRVLLVWHDGSITLAEVNITAKGRSKPKVGLTDVASNLADMTAVFMYFDEDGFLGGWQDRFHAEGVSAGAKGAAGKATDKDGAAPTTQEDDLDDEDALLYGDDDDDDAVPVGAKEDEEDDRTVKDEGKGIEAHSHRATYIFGITKDDRLTIVSLPDFEVVYRSNSMQNNVKCLRNLKIGAKALDIPDAHLDEDAKLSPPVEICVAPMGFRSRPVVIVLRASGQLNMFEAIDFVPHYVDIQALRSLQTDVSTVADDNHDRPTKGAVPLRFISVGSDYLRQLDTSEADDEAQKVFFNPEEEDDVMKAQTEMKEAKKFKGVNLLVPFTKLAASDGSRIRGALVLGEYPTWVFLTNKNGAQVQPIALEASVQSFAPLHNVNVPFGYCYFNARGSLRICQIRSNSLTQFPLPLLKVPLRSNSHGLAYHPESKTYVVITSTPQRWKDAPRMNNEERLREVREEEELPEMFAYPTEEVYTVKLVSPLNWTVIDEHEMRPLERVVDVKAVSLKSQTAGGQLREFVAVSTVGAAGEACSARGRVLIFQIIAVNPQPGRPETNHKLKLLYDKEQRGPVTQIHDCGGHLMTNIGQKIIVQEFEDSGDTKLSGRAFVDTQIYLNNIIVHGQVAAVSDIYCGVRLLHYAQEDKTLALASRDPHHRLTYHLNWFVEGKNLAILSTDEDGNCYVQTYEPLNTETDFGSYLYPRIAFNIGDAYGAGTRYRCNPSIDPKTGQVRLSTRHANLLGSVSGSFAVVLPIPEKSYRRLNFMQNKLRDVIEPLAGLNFKGARLLRSKDRSLSGTMANYIDGDLVWRFRNLPSRIQSNLAKQYGTKIATIMDEDLLATQRAFRPSAL
eukprot:Clim_evm81s142 gene=Clim_evmTU81s142